LSAALSRRELVLARIAGFIAVDARAASKAGAAASGVT
jgi:hypothetical protein